MSRIEIDEPITLEAYNENWPFQFDSEVDRLTPALVVYSPEFAHFGSTAVPGMFAKPTIDILIGVDEIPPTHKFVQQIVARVYEYLGEADIPGRHYFRRRASSSYNLAVVKKRGNLWRDNLAVRDYLRANPESVSDYNAQKKSVLEKGVTTLLRYSAEKSGFMNELLLRARFKK